MYPKKKGGKFNFDYYLNKHVPLIKERFGESLKRYEIYQGISRESGIRVPFITIASLWFENLDEFKMLFERNARDITADRQNFSNIQPILQIENQLLG
jgi:uncharacterized protein (TIGR02118 family)